MNADTLRALAAEQTLAHLRDLASQPLTEAQLREASDWALLAVGWCRHRYQRDGRCTWTATDGKEFRSDQLPHPCASLDDAVRWMVPEGLTVHIRVSPYGASAEITKNFGYKEYQFASQESSDSDKLALALTIAGLAASLEGDDR